MGQRNSVLLGDFEILEKYLFYDNKSNLLASYFDKYSIYLRNNNLNFFAEGVNKHKF